MKRKHTALLTKNFIFGVEDSLVSTVGLLSGVAAANVERETIFLTGVILILVETLSMGDGSFLSEQSAVEYTTNDETPHTRNIVGGLVIFFSYFAAGFIPLTPSLS